MKAMKAMKATNALATKAMKTMKAAKAPATKAMKTMKATKALATKAMVPKAKATKAMKAMKAMKVMKAMKSMSVIEHFARSDMADWAAMLLSSKLDAMYTRDVYPVTSQLCQTVCRATLLHIVMGLLGSIGALDTVPGVVSITCILYCVRMCFRMLISFLPQSCIDAQQAPDADRTGLCPLPCPYMQSRSVWWRQRGQPMHHSCREQGLA